MNAGKESDTLEEQVDDKSRRSSKISESMMFFKTNMPSFVTITMQELTRLQGKSDEDFESLINFFASPDNPSSISLKDLRHMISEILAPTKLSRAETTQFLKASGIVFPKNPKINEVDFFIDSKLLQGNMIIGNDPVAIVPRTK